MCHDILHSICIGLTVSENIGQDFRRVKLWVCLGIRCYILLGGVLLSCLGSGDISLASLVETVAARLVFFLTIKLLQFFFFKTLLV